jgi:hypothetical protein
MSESRFKVNNQQDRPERLDEFENVDKMLNHGVMESWSPVKGSWSQGVESWDLGVMESSHGVQRWYAQSERNILKLIEKL